jgi:hypothetical protein
MIRHIVTWKLMAEDAAEKAAAFDQLAAGFGPLPGLIPEVRSLTLGRDVDETGGNWDVVLLIDFENTADIETYQGHPEHEKVRSIVRSLTRERSAIDFEF